MPAYEISNHAQPGAESRHNLVYWRYGDYAGIGPGAHGRLTRDGVRLATEATRAPEAWLEAVEAGRGGMLTSAEVSPSEQAIEMAMMGLRLAEGINVDRYAALAGNPFDLTTLDEFSELGLVEAGTGRLRATAAGRAVLDALLRRLLT